MTVLKRPLGVVLRRSRELEAALAQAVQYAAKRRGRGNPSEVLKLAVDAVLSELRAEGRVGLVLLEPSSDPLEIHIGGYEAFCRCVRCNGTKTDTPCPRCGGSGRERRASW